MERTAADIETELVDLSASTLHDLDRDRTLHPEIQRLLDAVVSQPVATNSSTDQGGETCPTRTFRHPGRGW
ncbi:hypothetical protein [Streptomyces sp. NPDC018031]|uniref:hypothetical protein n=1 Tax=Streptomyces sp. NPDC018031 TaxID=3365033 RepID=UPI0037AFD6E6